MTTNGNESNFILEVHILKNIHKLWGKKVVCRHRNTRKKVWKLKNMVLEEINLKYAFVCKTKLQILPRHHVKRTYFLYSAVFFFFLLTM